MLPEADDPLHGESRNRKLGELTFALLSTTEMRSQARIDYNEKAKIRSRLTIVNKLQS